MVEMVGGKWWRGVVVVVGMGMVGGDGGCKQSLVVVI